MSQTKFVVCLHIVVYLMLCSDRIGIAGNGFFNTVKVIYKVSFSVCDTSNHCMHEHSSLSTKCCLQSLLTWFSVIS